MDKIASYNAVKRNRRRLAARAEGAYSIHISMEIYSTFIAELNDQQLEFERLKVLAGVATDSRLPQACEFKGVTYGDAKSAAIVSALAAIEKNLNHVIKEQRDQLAGLPEKETPFHIPRISWSNCCSARCSNHCGVRRWRSSGQVKRIATISNHLTH
ncbi:hypothetical protein [Paractinoplanes globisporus]|uniref:Uncharacterized protein n=1 Tax=Paractinoplanes globisporus TaxID=113565 RepID=A0ABW6WC69_9ACTN|nr:hypothetical protein [Actinoplanes globisporus]